MMDDSLAAFTRLSLSSANTLLSAHPQRQHTTEPHYGTYRAYASTSNSANTSANQSPVPTQIHSQTQIHSYSQPHSPSSLPQHHLSTVGISPIPPYTPSSSSPTQPQTSAHLSSPSSSLSHNPLQYQQFTYQLLKSCREGDIQLVKELLTTISSSGTTYNINATDSDGDSALLQAIKASSNNGADLVYLLVVDYNADVNHANYHGETALTLALQQSPLNIDIILFLLQCGASLQHKNQKGMSALMYAEQLNKHRSSLIDALRVAEYSPIRRLLEKKDNRISALTKQSNHQQHHLIDTEQQLHYQQQILHEFQSIYQQLHNSIESTIQRISQIHNELNVLHQQESHILIKDAIQIIDSSNVALLSAIQLSDNKIRNVSNLTPPSNGASSAFSTSPSPPPPSNINITSYTADEMRGAIKRAMNNRDIDGLGNLLVVTRMKQLPVYPVLLQDAEYMLKQSHWPVSRS